MGRHTQQKLIALMTKSANGAYLTPDEQNFLDSLSPYQKNRVIQWNTPSVISSGATFTSATDILIAEGATLPTGYPGFKQGAIFYLLPLGGTRPGRNMYCNTGNKLVASWTMVMTTAVSSPSPSISALTNQIGSMSSIVAATTE